MIQSMDEARLRVDLAACYRLVALFGWDDLVFTHISVKLPGNAGFLINPYGVLFEEMTASSLVRVDEAANKLVESPHAVNPAGFAFHPRTGDFYFEDNGIGFEEKYLDKIFAVFQRLHGRTEYEGTGIGLAVCRRITDTPIDQIQVGVK